MPIKETNGSWVSAAGRRRYFNRDREYLPRPEIVRLAMYARCDRAAGPAVCHLHCNGRILSRARRIVRGLQLGLHSGHVFVDAGQPIAPMAAPFRNETVGDIGDVDAACTLRHSSPCFAGSLVVRKSELP